MKQILTVYQPGNHGKPYPRGLDLINEDMCPIQGVSSMACMVCPYGHMLECHYPLSCREAQCQHLSRSA